MSHLASLLHSTFGHANFRANQEAVCVAATAGKDVLLVMPTGAGKSLCYQLPAIARQLDGNPSAALVISPLIALMDDQAAKLSAHGLRVARIHSGLSRDHARQACRDYLDGNLDFLFIAPERMRVPGFPAMLARRKPSLIAIDEAHCISAWGHDFRPDYRTLGEHLPALRPAPIIALTATATPTVQRDIVAQLNLHDPALFIHGFRRSNLAIEVVEMSKPRRHEFAATLLHDPASRPAIVYAPSRKAAEELAAELNQALRKSAKGGIDKSPGAPSFALHAKDGIDEEKPTGQPRTSNQIVAAYHAGLESSTRERVQSAFQSGNLEVVVATIAFGMGIDKADVRTVIHTALPASVEAYYQEIGRAGRDGLPSRTILLHSYADRKMHEFFFERDYPPANDLARVVSVLADEDLMPEPLARRLKMDLNTFQKAIEKLAAQGAASIDLAGNVRRTGNVSQAGAWRAGYEAQLAFRRAQLDRMAAFAETQQCRMTAVIRHFGDTADAHRPCGNCDFCSPHTTSAQSFAAPTTEQGRHLRSILRTLDARATSTGKLHTELAPTLGRDITRRDFDVLLDALARAGLITLTAETFTNPTGDVIPYKKAALTHEGRSDDATELTGVLLPNSHDDASPQSRKKSKARTAKSSTPNKLGAPGQAASSPDLGIHLTPTQQALNEALRNWRKSEAAKTGKPAFMVLSDAVIRNIAIANPQSIPELLTISGIGPNKADQLGASIIALCRDTPASQASLKSDETPSRQARLSRASISAEFELSSASLDVDPASRYDKPSGSDPSADASRYPKPSDLDPSAAPSRYPKPSDLDPSADASRYPKPSDLDPSAAPSRYPKPSGLGLSPNQSNGASAPGVSRQSHNQKAHTRTPTPDPTESLTPTQLALDESLRNWRKSEAERLGLPQFFVLGASTLRSLVLLRPQTLAQLQTISGIGPDKIDRFGPAILTLCNAPD